MNSYVGREHDEPAVTPNPHPPPPTQSFILKTRAVLRLTMMFMRLQKLLAGVSAESVHQVLPLARKETRSPD